VDSASIAAISSAAVALATIGASLLRQRSTLRQARQLADLQSVRVILDEAAAALHEVEYVLNDLRSSLARLGYAFARADDGSDVDARLVGCGRTLDRLLERLKIRLGPDHAAVVAFAAADESVLEIHRALGPMRAGSERPQSSRRDRDAEGRLDEQRDRVAAERESFDAMRSEFIVTAQSAAGVHLPPRRHRWRA
jgi:precorrin-6B methylase 2